MNNSCTICLVPLKLTCDVFTTHCGNIFHTRCITRWLQKEEHSCSRNCCRIIKYLFSKTDPQTDGVENISVGTLLKLENKFKAEQEGFKFKADQEELKLKKKIQWMKGLVSVMLLIMVISSFQMYNLNIHFNGIQEKSNLLEEKSKLLEKKSNLLEENHRNMYKMILEKNLKMECGWTSLELHLAAKYGYKEIFEMILKEITQIGDGMTPCHWAILGI